MKYLLGIDIGGTKCAVSLGNRESEVLARRELATVKDPGEMLEAIFAEAGSLMKEGESLEAIGIVCGGPLDIARGRIMSPPNLPRWDDIAVVEYFSGKFGVPGFLQNDANAGALAEWRLGAGRGSNNMMFCTMGTGFGCGLILGGRLYEGVNGNAGELGHVRLTQRGPIGYGKSGSVEGWCSGGGIAQIAENRIEELKKDGAQSLLLESGTLTAQSVAQAADQGDDLAQRIYAEVGEHLGSTLAMAIDILNLETIVIGSIFLRSEALIRPSMERVLKLECLPGALEACRIKPAELGEKIGDVAALTVALEGIKGTL